MGKKSNVAFALAAAAGAAWASTKVLSKPRKSYHQKSIGI